MNLKCNWSIWKTHFTVEGKIEVILVDIKDKPIGRMEKLKAHLDGGHLHRAFSIFIFNKKNELLIQKRAARKYHSPSLWSNSCCGHPNKSENTKKAAEKRLFEELGISVKLKEISSIIYKLKLNDQLTEYEFDHIFIGKNNTEKIPFNEKEVSKIRWIGIQLLNKEIKQYPESFTSWFKLIWKEKHKALT